MSKIILFQTENKIILLVSLNFDLKQDNNCLENALDLRFFFIFWLKTRQKNVCKKSIFLQFLTL